MQNIAEIGYLKVGASVALCAALAFGLGWRYVWQPSSSKTKSKSVGKIKEKVPHKGQAGSTHTGGSSDVDESQHEKDLRGDSFLLSSLYPLTAD